MNTPEIERFLPHRYPFLLVNRVVELVPDQSIKAFKNLTSNEAFFQGHFPGQPVMPGVLMVEALAQAAALLAFKSLKLDGPGAVYLVGLDGVRFRRLVVPGDQLDLTVTIQKRKGKVWKMRGEAFVEGQMACEADLMATVPDGTLPEAPA